jgi:large subunit ribosomal protein L9
MAIEATSGNMKALERIRTSLAKKTATELETAQKQVALLNDVALNFKRKTGENEQMFGSVTSGDISEALAAQNFKVDKRQIHIAEPIKALGDYTVTIKVFRDINATVRVHVEKENVE